VPFGAQRHHGDDRPESALRHQELKFSRKASASETERRADRVRHHGRRPDGATRPGRRLTSQNQGTLRTESGYRPWSHTESAQERLTRPEDIFTQASCTFVQSSTDSWSHSRFQASSQLRVNKTLSDKRHRGPRRGRRSAEA